MKDLFRAFQRIPEKNRTIAYAIIAVFKNLLFFAFKIIVGIIFKTPLLIVIAVYNLLVGVIMANCSRRLLKQNDDLKDCQAYILGGVILLVSSILYIVYNIYQVGNPYNIEYNMPIAIVIASMAAFTVAMSINGLVKTKGRTMLIQEYKFTKFATALNNIVLTQIALLAIFQVPNMHYYNSIVGTINGLVILGFGLYIIVSGLIKLKVYTTGVTNAKQPSKENNEKKESQI